jgi:hypothetical protein
MRIIMLTLMGLFFVTSAVAQQRPKAEMISEDDTEDHRRCGVSHDGLKAAAAGVLRRSGYQISPHAELDTMVVYVNATPIGTRSGCAVSLSVEFYFDALASAPWGQRYFVKHIICRKGAVRTGSPGTIQAHLRSDATEFTEICISEEEQKRRR